MSEINLLELYPKSKRPIEERGRRIGSLSGALEERDNADILFEYKLLDVARRFGKEYFDGDRLFGYGGYYYDPRFWTETVRKFIGHYGLNDSSSVLDVGCAKGFMMFDFKKLIPKMNMRGIDISQYAFDKAIDEMKPFITVGNARELPYPDNSYDLVLSINTVDHLPLDDCKRAIKEIQRVTKKDSFISVNAWRTDEERERILKWNVTALTCMHVDDWIELFNEIGYMGDYWWFIAE